MWRGLNTDECGEPNAFAVQGAVSAFTKGMPWLEELRTYIWENRKMVEQFVKEEIPSLKTIKSDATYLIWIDISKTGMDGETFAEKLREKTGLILSEGNQYGKGGQNFVRMNLATSKEIVKDALSRLKKFCQPSAN